MDPAAAAEPAARRSSRDQRPRVEVRFGRIHQVEMAAKCGTPRSPVLMFSNSFRFRGIGHPRVRGRRSIEGRCLGDAARRGLGGHGATTRAARPAVRPRSRTPRAPDQLTPSDAATSERRQNDLGLTCGTYLPTGKLVLSDTSAVRPTKSTPSG